MKIIKPNNNSVSGVVRTKSKVSLLVVVGIGVVLIATLGGLIIGGLLHLSTVAAQRSATNITPGQHLGTSGTLGTSGKHASKVSVRVMQPKGSISVASFGVDPTGTSDSIPGFVRALDAAQAKPNSTLYIPAGRYIFDDLGLSQCELCIHVPVHIVGAGAAFTTLVNEVGLKNPHSTKSLVMIEIFSATNGSSGGADGTTISGLTLDSATYDAGTDIMDFGNHTTLSNLTVHAATSTDTYNPNSFGVRVITVCKPNNFNTKFRVDNRVTDVTITGNGAAGNTELDLSCQVGTSVSNISIDGNGMDIYISRDIKVSDATLIARAGIPGHAMPYSWVMNDSSNVTLENLVTDGNAGVIVQHLENYPCTNVTIDNEVVNSPTTQLFIGDVNHMSLNPPPPHGRGFVAQAAWVFSKDPSLTSFGTTGSKPALLSKTFAEFLSLGISNPQTSQV